MKREAAGIGADEVVGLKTYVYDLGGGMLEFLSIGTAIKKVPGLKTASDALMPQAITKEPDRVRPNYVNNSYRELVSETSMNTGMRLSLNPESDLNNIASNNIFGFIPANNPLISYILPILIIMSFVLLPMAIRGCTGH